MKFKYFTLAFLSVFCFCTLSATEIADSVFETDNPPSQWPPTMASGTLPVIYINTVDSLPIVSKTDYIDATYWLDPLDTGFEAFGSAEQPLKTEIRGRGNYTWNAFDKKPYKLKLDKKAGFFGLPKSKHWALLADANSGTAFSTALGMEISRKMGLAWTPSCQAVEVVLNGEYMGFYTLCETVRVDEDRVNIHEQADLETDPDEIAGAWLLEIDNTYNDYQINLTDANGYAMSISPDTPEILSDEQTLYLSAEMNRLNDLINAEDKSDSTELEEILDINAFARYYLTLEIMHDLEGFYGSCYFYKDAEPGSKWTFGPVWDWGNALSKLKEGKRIYESNPANHWVDQLVQFPAIMEEIKKVWYEFFSNNPAEYFSNFVADYIDYITPAYTGPESQRWPEYNIPLSWYRNQIPGRITENYALVDEWYHIPKLRWPAKMASGTLPVIHINTDEESPIPNASESIDATLWMEAESLGFENFGSKTDPIRTKIRDTENISESQYDKKPYRLEFSDKVSFFGLTESMHWDLHADVESPNMFTGVIGMEIGKKIGLDRTPSLQPVEIVINGVYMGVYTLGESVNIDENTGGWLIRIDGNGDDNSVCVETTAGNKIFITAVSPESLSDTQKQYLTEQIELLSTLISTDDKTNVAELEAILDINAFARYYLANEIMDNQSAFASSCYMYKDPSPDAKWTFGYIGNLKNALTRDKGEFRLYESDIPNLWVEELVHFPVIRNEIKHVWHDFIENNPVEYFSTFLIDYSDHLEKAYNEVDAERWPRYHTQTWNKNQMAARLAHNYSVVSSWYPVKPDLYVFVPYGPLTDDGLESMDWLIMGAFNEQRDGTYEAFVDLLPSTFRIASLDGNSYCIGAPYGAEPINNSILYPVEEAGETFTADFFFRRATLDFDPYGKTLLITCDGKTANEEFIIKDDSSPSFSMASHTILAHETVNIYTPLGQIITTLHRGESTTLSPGMYLVRGSFKTEKIHIQ